MQLDKDRLEKLAPQLRAQDIDPESLPEPGRDEWRTMIRDLSLRDPVLAQSTAGLVFDPNELTRSSLVDQQATRSQARGGVGKMLSPLMKTKTANGDEVPNTALTRNLVIGGAVLLGAAFWFGIPHAQPAKVSRTSSSGSGTSHPTSSVKPTSTPSTSSSGGIPNPTQPASSGSTGVSDHTASPAVNANSSDPTGLGSTDRQAAPSQDAVQTSPVIPVSTPSDPTGFQTPPPTGRTAVVESSAPPSAPVAVPRARVAPMTVRTPVPPTGAGPVRLSAMKTTPSLPVAPKPRLVALASGAANGAAGVPVRRLVASSGDAGSSPASSGSGTSARGLKSSAASNSAAADQAETSPRGRLLNTAAAVPSAQVIALKVTAPVSAPAAVQLVSTQGAAASPVAAVNSVQATSSAAGGGQGGGQSVTPASGHPGLGLSSAATQNAAGTVRYGLLQSGTNQMATPQGNDAAASAAPERQALGLLSQGPAPSAASNAPASNSASSHAPVNATSSAASSASGPVATSYGLKGLGPTRTTPSASATSPAASSTPAAPSPASANPVTPPAAVAQAPTLPPYPVGQPLAAKLVLGVVAVDGLPSTVPVFAKTDDGATWRGSASLDGRQRLQIQFSAVLRNGAEQAITADAYGSDGQPGLAASVRITTPTLAADLLSGVFSGVKAFADATINQRNVSVQGGTGNTGNVVTSTAANTPNFWLVTAGNALGQFQLPQNKATIVNVAEVKAGTALNLVVRGEQR